MQAGKSAIFYVVVIRKAISLGDNKRQKMPCLLKVAGEKKFIDILQEQLLIALLIEDENHHWASSTP